MNVKMAWANLTPQSHINVGDVLSRGWLSYSLYMPRFEKLVAAKHGAKHGVLVNSGTDALRISLAVLKEVKKWKDNSEVIVPALTFVATVNAVIQNGLKPVFADVGNVTGNIGPETIARVLGPRTVAIIPVHLFGLPVSMSAVIPIAEKRKLSLVEDSCEAFGVHRVEGDMACFSFYMSHHVSTGVGGMILTNSAQYERLARSYMNHGRIDDGSHFKFGRSGYSSRITEMEAALGCAAMDHFDKDLLKRRSLAKTYFKHLDHVGDIEQPIYCEGHSWMFYPICLKGNGRDKLMAHLRKRCIESREAMPLINQPVFKEFYKKGSCPNAEHWTNNGMLLPLHPQMKESDAEYVCEKVEAFFK